VYIRNPHLPSGRLRVAPFHALHTHKYSSAVLLPSACSNKKPLALRHEQQDWLKLCGNELWHALVFRAINVLLPVQQRVTRFSTLYRLHLPINILQQVHQCHALRKCRTRLDIVSSVYEIYHALSFHYILHDSLPIIASVTTLANMHCTEGARPPEGWSYFILVTHVAGHVGFPASITWVSSMTCRRDSRSPL
jgi:hypothetical protein